MKIGDYIKAKFTTWAVSLTDAEIDLELMVLGLSASDDMTGEINLDTFFYKVIPDFLLMPNSISEGGYSVSFDKDALTNYYRLLAKRLGKYDDLQTNRITDISNQW